MSNNYIKLYDTREQVQNQLEAETKSAATLSALTITA